MGDRGRRLVQLACNTQLITDIGADDNVMELPPEKLRENSSMQDVTDIGDDDNVMELPPENLRQNSSMPDVTDIGADDNVMELPPENLRQNCSMPDVTDIGADDNVMELPPENLRQNSSMQDVTDTDWNDKMELSTEILCRNNSIQDVIDIAGPSTSLNDVDIISNSSSDLDLAQLDMVFNSKNCLFGSDYSDIDPTYVPDSDEHIQNDSASEGNVIIPESPDMENSGNEADKECVMLILENLLDRVWLSVKPLTRRKRAQPKEWKRNINKLRKAEGLSYTTNGVTRPAKVPKSIECAKCSFKCTEKFSFEERNNLCRHYYSLDFISKKNFILSCLKIQPVKTRKLQKTSNKKDRMTSKKYFFRKNHENIQVCLNFFKATLCISVDVITDAVNKSDSLGVYNSADQRGKKEPPNKTNPEDIAFVQQHIESFPVMESHYCRKDTKKRYLAPDVKSINNMYRLYQELCKDSGRVAVSSFMYRNVFNKSYNFSFFQPKKDLCNICVKYDKAESKEGFEEEYREHLQRKKICQAEKDADKVRANTDESFMSITMDLQAVLQIPSGGESILYYMRKLVLYNFTIYEAKLPNNAYCLCWSEVNGKKGSCEIGTCLYYFLSKELPQSVKEISIFSDTCSGQNRNQNISALLLWAVQKIDHLNIIEQKFLESGHTHMEVDSMHAAIEAASKNKTINSVSEWKNIFTAARKKRSKIVTKEGVKQTIEINNYKVREFKFNEMLDLKSLSAAIIKNKNKDNMNETVNWLKIKRIKYMKGDLKLYYNYDMSNNFRSIDISKNYINTPKTRAKRYSNPPSVNLQELPELELLYSTRIPISIAKKKDLMKMCEKLIIPEELHAWIRDMKTHSQQPAFESEEE